MRRLLEEIVARSPSLRLKIWGNQWERARPFFGSRIEGREVTGLEYSKALLASKINLGILSEIRSHASSGDRITARTFQIPATGAFMLHERTAEFGEYFEEGTECGCFESAEELVQKIEFYLGHDEERKQVAAAGRARSMVSDYSVHARAKIVLRKAQNMLVAQRQRAA